MRKFCFFSIVVPLIAAAVQADTLVVTASNAAANQLLVYNSGGQLIQTVATQGKGGVSGNAGGIETNGKLVAVVNFGSNSVSVFERRGEQGFQVKQLVPTVSSPVSVAFSADHLYILGATKVESHRMDGSNINSNPDGVVTLLKADGSAAQVGVVQNQLIITEKSNVIETVKLSGGAVSGVPTLVMNIPANVNTPFGLVTRGNNAYVTIAHANEISLVRNGTVLTTTSSLPELSPCWLALEGPFLFSSNSPSMNISRYAVYGQKIVQDAAVAASLNGAPTDIATAGGLVAVIDGNGPVSHLSIFSVDEDGNLTLLQSAATITGAANGIAIVRDED
jgi:hypothetical protein